MSGSVLYFFQEVGSLFVPNMKSDRDLKGSELLLIGLALYLVGGILLKGIVGSLLGIAGIIFMLLCIPTYVRENKQKKSVTKDNER